MVPKKKLLKDDFIGFKVTSVERERIENLCKKTGLDISGLIRLVVLGMPDEQIEKIGRGEYALTPSGRIIWLK